MKKSLLNRILDSKALKITYLISAIVFVLHLFLHAAPFAFGGWVAFEYLNHTHEHTHNHDH